MTRYKKDQLTEHFGALIAAVVMAVCLGGIMFLCMQFKNAWVFLIVFGGMFVQVGLAYMGLYALINFTVTLVFKR